MAIAGGTGSGKSTLAERLSDALGAPILRMDDYYRCQAHLSPEARRGVNYDAPESVEHTLLLDQMAAIARGGTVEKPVYDFARDTRSALTEPVGPAPVILVEGIFALGWDELNARCPVRLFVETPEAVRFARRLRRDVEERGRDAAEVDARFRDHVAPMHDRWVAPSKARATRVLSGERPVPRLVAEALADLAPAALPSTFALR